MIYHIIKLATWRFKIDNTEQSWIMILFKLLKYWIFGTVMLFSAIRNKKIKVLYFYIFSFRYEYFISFETYLADKSNFLSASSDSNKIKFIIFLNCSVTKLRGQHKANRLNVNSSRFCAKNEQVAIFILIFDTAVNS